MKPVFMAVAIRFQDEHDYSDVQNVLSDLSNWTHKVVSCDETEIEGELFVTVHILFNDGDELMNFFSEHSFEDGDKVTELVSGDFTDAEHVYATRFKGPGLELTRKPSRNWSFE